MPVDDDILNELKNISSILEQSTGGGSAGGGGASSTPDRVSGRSGLDVDPADERFQPDALTGKFPSSSGIAGAGGIIRGIGDFIQNRSSTPSRVAETFQRTGASIQYSAQQYIPKAEYYANAVNQTVIQPMRTLGARSTSLNRLGELQGYSAAGGDVSLGPFGMRTPFNRAALEGLKIQANILKDSLQAGVTRGQAENIYGSLTERGMYQGTNTFDNAKQAMINLTKFNSTIGQSAQAFDIIDRSVRTGTTSFEEMSEVLKGVVPAAKAAHVNFEQMMSDMTAMGEFYKTQGGTFAKGAEAAIQMTTASGIAPQAMLKLQQSGFVQARQMQQTGLAPWQLGLMSSQQRLTSSLETVQMLSKQLGPVGPDQITTDEFGFKETISGSAKQAATIAQMTGMPAEQIQLMLKNAPKIKAGARIQRGMSNYADEAERIMGSGMSESEKMSRLSSLSEGGGYQKILQSMKTGGFSEDAIKAVMEAGGDIDTGSAGGMSKRIKARYEEFEKQLGKISGGTQYQEGPQVLVGLSPEAMKYLKIKPSDANKAEAGAGNGTTISGAVAVPIRGTLSSGF